MSSYATVAEFNVHGIRPEAIPPAIVDADKIAAIEAASLVADSYLSSQFHMPIITWGTDLTRAVCAIAAYELVASLLVFQPDPATNQVLTDRAESARSWLKDISAGRARPNVVDTAPSAKTASRVFSKPPRGW